MLTNSRAEHSLSLSLPVRGKCFKSRIRPVALQDAGDDDDDDDVDR